MVPSRDGRQIPVSIVYRRGFERNGQGRLFLYAYGAYGIATPPGFNTNRFSLLDRGYAFAIAHIRGGDEHGLSMVSRRQARPADQHLQRFRRRRPRPDRAELHARRPDRDPGRLGRRRADGRGGQPAIRSCGARWSPTCRSSTCSTPCSTKRLPLTPGEWNEWGNPITDATAFRYHAELFSPTTMSAPGLSADADHRRPQRSARHLLGAGQMGRAAAGDAHRRQSPAAQDQHGRRPWRPVRPLDAAARGGRGLCLHPDPEWAGPEEATDGEGSRLAALAAAARLPSLPRRSAPAAARAARSMSPWSATATAGRAEFRFRRARAGAWVFVRSALARDRRASPGGRRAGRWRRRAFGSSGAAIMTCSSPPTAGAVPPRGAHPLHPVRRRPDRATTTPPSSSPTARWRSTAGSSTPFRIATPRHAAAAAARRPARRSLPDSATRVTLPRRDRAGAVTAASACRSATLDEDSDGSYVLFGPAQPIVTDGRSATIIDPQLPRLAAREPLAARAARDPRPLCRGCSGPAPGPRPTIMVSWAGPTPRLEQHGRQHPARPDRDDLSKASGVLQRECRSCAPSGLVVHRP